MHRPAHNGDAFSHLHPKMPRGSRAKLFAPFDALSGFDESMDAETVYTVHPAELTEEMREELDARWRELQDRFQKLPGRKTERKGKIQISVLYFQENTAQTILHDDGPRGTYVWLSGDVLDVDPIGRTMLLGERRLEFARIYAIE